jgi:hypothetical protein
MQWEIALAAILAIGIYTAIRESRNKRSAHKEETGEIVSENHSSEELFLKNNK